uniref:Superoxide dismutase n=1 Tax=Cyclophora tenuis TaxID=216820 RepID=A0A7S1CWY5_CYCTE
MVDDTQNLLTTKTTMASSTGSKLLNSAIRAAVHVNSAKLPTELAKSSAAYLSSAPSGGTHTLPDLPYDYNALEPVISAETMELHHSKHHNTYVTNLNVALEKLDAAVTAGDVSGIIALQGALKFNGGGHVNHTLFWENLSPTSEFKDGPLKDLVVKCYGSYDAMKEDLTAVTVPIQGSGWGWLGYNPKSGKIESSTCANQDPLEATTGLVPLMGIDVWEHAYYVDYRNVRPNYVNAIWDRINWDVVEQRLVAAQSS